MSDQDREARTIAWVMIFGVVMLIVVLLVALFVFLAFAS